jgi:hypothetical protein
VDITRRELDSTYLAAPCSLAELGNIGARMTWKKAIWKDFFDPQPSEIAPSKDIFEKKQAQIPRPLFRLRSFDPAGRNIDATKTAKIWMSSADRFNDPYDCGLSVASSNVLVDDLPIRELFERVERLKAGEEPSYGAHLKTPIMPDLFMEKVMQALTVDPNHKALLREVFAEQHSRISAELARKVTTFMQEGHSVCCFTERVDSIALWGLYGDGHKGFAIAYDFASLHETDPRQRMLFPVYYREELFDWVPYLNAFAVSGKKQHRMGIAAAVSKSTEWSYEREWRLVYNYGPPLTNFLLDAPPVIGIYAGSRVEASNLQVLREISAALHAPLFQMELDAHRFSMQPKLVVAV